MTKRKDVWAVNIRPFTDSDLSFAREISRLTWEGTDYLGAIAEHWLQDGHFFVAEYDGKPVGVTKLTLLPDGVAWLEGLRVHPDFRGHGIARQLNEYLVRDVLERISRGEQRYLEFCTYFLNKESIDMATRAGFEVVWGNYLLRRAVSKRRAVPQEVALPESLLAQPEPYFAVGWKSVHNTPDGLEWLRSHARGYEYNGVFFYTAGYEMVAWVPDLDEQKLLAVMPALNTVFAETGDIELLIPRDRAELIPMLKSHRFSFWCPVTGPNQLIFRYFPRNFSQR
jgi:GNAT superfamily N-acetyltransferase